MTDSRKDLPPVNSPNFLEKVREALSVYLGNRGNKMDRGLTVRDLADAGLIDLNPRWLAGGGGASPVGGPGSAVGGADPYEVDLTPPPTPTWRNGIWDNSRAGDPCLSAGITNLLLTCDPQTYTQGNGHAKSKLYGATWTAGPLPVFTDAVVITEFGGTVASHATNPATTWHLWLTWVTIDGVESTVPAGGTNGVVATTGQDVALLLDALSGEITASQLHATLGTRINLIDAASGVAGSVNARLATETLARTNALTLEASTRAAAILAEAGKRSTAVNDLQNQIDTVVAIAGGDLSEVIAVVQTEQTARAAADAAEAAARETLAVQMRGDYTGTDASAITTGLIYSERQARIAATEAEVSNRNAAIVSNLADTEATLTALNTALLAGLSVMDSAAATRTQAEQDARIAAVTSETNARISADEAEASARLALVAVVNSNAAIVTQEQTARATADATLASQINTLSSSYNANTVAIQTEATTRATQTGELFAQYTVKIDVNGKVSGFGLASTGPTGAGSTFEIRADKFSIAAPTGSAAGYVPFSVLATSTVIGGVTFPAGVYAQRAFIQDLQVTSAKIANLAVDDAKIANLSAAKLTIGDGTVGGNLKSSNYVAGSAGWILQPNGYAEMQNAVVRGTVYATAGEIGGITIASNAVRAGQSAYNTGTGFHLGSDGRLSLGNSAGNRLTWDNTSLAITGALTATTIATNSGKFAVSSGGLLTATEANISGAITATSGSFTGSITGSTINSTSSLNGVTGTFSGTLTANAIDAVNTINIAGNAVSVVNSGSGGAGCSTTLTVPANQTMRIVGIGYYANYRYEYGSTVNGSPTLTIDGITVSNRIYGTVAPFGRDGSVHVTSGSTLINYVDCVAGASDRTVTISIGGTYNSSGTNKVIAFGTLR